MDKLIIEFNKKFDKQKQELIDGFKALGEEKRLPKALATIEGEQPTYKDYFKAGWQSRQAEVDELQEEYAETELYLRGQLTDRDSKIANLEYLLEQDKSLIPILDKKLEEKDKRIEELESRLKAVHALARMRSAVINADRWFTLRPHIKNAIKCLDRKEKALRGEHEA